MTAEERIDAGWRVVGIYYNIKGGRYGWSECASFSPKCAKERCRWLSKRSRGDRYTAHKVTVWSRKKARLINYKEKEAMKLYIIKSGSYYYTSVPSYSKRQSDARVYTSAEREFETLDPAYGDRWVRLRRCRKLLAVIEAAKVWREHLKSAIDFTREESILIRAVEDLIDVSK